MDPMLAAILQSSDPTALLQDRRPEWAQGGERVGGFQSVASPEARRFAAASPEEARANVRGTVQDTVLEPAKTYAKAFLQMLGKASVGKPEERLDTEADVRKQSYAVGEGFFNPVSGMIGMLAGQKAVGAPLEALKKAIAAEGKGVPSQEIWRKYGWERGADKQWRWEIPDDAARLREGNFPRDEIPGTVGSRLEHPALFAAYPHLKKNPLDLWPSSEIAGSYNPVQKGAISIRGPLNSQRKSLMHELQHGVQDYERFASGGSPDAMGWTEVSRVRATPTSPEDLRDLSLTAYRRLAGETEARNVEARLEDKNLRRFAPGVTEDIPRLLQLVRLMGDRSGN